MVVGEYVNVMMMTFNLYFDSCHGLKQHEYTKSWKQRETSLLLLVFIIMV